METHVEYIEICGILLPCEVYPYRSWERHKKTYCGVCDEFLSDEEEIAHDSRFMLGTIKGA